MVKHNNDASGMASIVRTILVMCVSSNQSREMVFIFDRLSSQHLDHTGLSSSILYEILLERVHKGVILFSFFDLPTS